MNLCQAIRKVSSNNCIKNKWEMYYKETQNLLQRYLPTMSQLEVQPDNDFEGFK